MIQSGIQSLPRELSLAENVSLRIRPLRELQSLRRDEWATGDMVVPAGGVTVLDTIAGDTLELEAVFSRPEAEAYGLVLFLRRRGERRHRGRAWRRPTGARRRRHRTPLRTR